MAFPGDCPHARYACTLRCAALPRDTPPCPSVRRFPAALTDRGLLPMLTIPDIYPARISLNFSVCGRRTRGCDPTQHREIPNMVYLLTFHAHAPARALYSRCRYRRAFQDHGLNAATATDARRGSGSRRRTHRLRAWMRPDDGFALRGARWFFGLDMASADNITMVRLWTSRLITAVLPLD